MKILVLTAHLDDAFFGAGGTLLNYLHKKEKIKVIYFFKSLETNVEIEKIKNLGFQIGFFPIKFDNFALLSLIELIRKENPKKLIAINGGTHIEHILSHEIISKAFALVGNKKIKTKSGPKSLNNVFYFETPDASFNNHQEKQLIYINISKNWEKKKEVLGFFASLKKVTPNFEKLIEAMPFLRGAQCGTRLAECFKAEFNLNNNKLDAEIRNKTLILDDEKKAFEFLP